MELLQNLCADVATDRTWDDKGLHTTNIRVVELEAQGLENFPEWREKLRVALAQIGWVEAAVKGLQVAFGDANVTQNRHEDELTLIFDKLSVFQEGFLHNIHTMTERVKEMEASTLEGSQTKGQVRWRRWCIRSWIWRKTGYQIVCALMGWNQC